MMRHSQQEVKNGKRQQGWFLNEGSQKIVVSQKEKNVWIFFNFIVV